MKYPGVHSKSRVSVIYSLSGFYRQKNSQGSANFPFHKETCDSEICVKCGGETRNAGTVTSLQMIELRAYNYSPAIWIILDFVVNF